MSNEEIFTNEIQLADGIRITADQPFELQRGIGYYSTRVDFMSDKPDKDALIKHYFVYTGADDVRSYLGITGVVNPKAIQHHALLIAEKRFKASGGQTPAEDGMKCFGVAEEPLAHEFDKVELPDGRVI